MATMAQETAYPRQHSNAYNIFIFVLTILSLAIMVVMLLPISDANPEASSRLRQPDLRHFFDRFLSQPERSVP